MAGFSIYSIAPYTGEWTDTQAAHLLRRTMYGPQEDDVKHAIAQGLEAILDEILSEQPLPDPPLNITDENDPTTPIGESWVYKPIVRSDNANQTINRRLIIHPRFPDRSCGHNSYRGILGV